MKGRCPRPLDERVETHGADYTQKDQAERQLILEDAPRVRQEVRWFGSEVGSFALNQTLARLDRVKPPRHSASWQRALHRTHRFAYHLIRIIYLSLVLNRVIHYSLSTESLRFRVS